MAVSPAMENLLRGMGIDPDSVDTGAAGVGFADPDDPDIPRPNPRMPGGVRVPRGSTPPKRARISGSGPSVEVPGTGTKAGKRATAKRSEVLKEFYRWNDRELRSFQEKAFKAGLYGTTDRKDIRWGDHDKDTFDIWIEMVDRAAGFAEVGKEITPEEAIDLAVTNAPTATEDTVDRGPLVLSVANPADLRVVFDAAARDILGRKLSPEEMGRMVAAYQALDRQAQEERFALEDPEGAGGAVDEAPNPQSFAEEQVLAVDPARAGAQDAAERMQEFYSFLQGVV